ncbi:MULTISPECIES: helicase HerA domain-containing protein [Thalassospira]|jgi:type IV secretory pathway VirB4 component|uniref:DUF87 domain-containing protein n=1 Tax=Thalassospira marina TaxID=2048283 RepID=A0A2N3KIS0_9PROT|nr:MULTISPECIES: DUF87 domain-containing protein [Thalassospira]OSQ39109.1 hypothetical protein THS27_21645 [Thalassospira sp. MCCC 1A01428]PKR50441.1 DUF87 domain-containing protein [Thalassospira marina]|tara:strand:- start:22073 stop:24667 length:2595 start_codon:yes stop_codon:yes gene_type:complete
MDINEQLIAAPDPMFFLYRLGLLAVCCIAVLLLFMPAVRAFFFPVIKRNKLSDHIAYRKIGNDGRTVICEDGTLFQVVRVRGLDSDSLPSDAQADLFLKRKAWLSNLSTFSGSPFEGRIICIDTRRLVDLARNSQNAISAWMDLVFGQYMKRFSRSYRNTHYVLVAVPGTAKLAQDQLDSAVTTMVRQLGNVEQGGYSYGAEPLELARRKSSNSQLLTFLAQMLNPGHTTVVRSDALGDNDVASLLCQSKVSFRSADFGIKPSDGLALFSYRARKTWMGAVMLRTSGMRWSETLSKRLLSLDHKLVLAQWITPWDRRKSRAYVQEAMKTGGQEGVTGATANELIAAEELIDIQSSEAGELFFEYEITVFVHGETRAEVLKGISAVVTVFEDERCTAVQVTDELDERWFSLFPPYQARTRPLTPCTSNIANFVCFPSPQQGFDKCDWGQRAVQYFHTASKSAYGFIFHALDHSKAAGHTAIFGQTGGGKTVLQNILAASTLGYPDARVFILDRYDSSYVFTKACGGKYIYIDTSHEVPASEIARLNPFSLDLRADGSGDTLFVQQWLAQHTLCLDDAESLEHISRILRGMSRLDPSKRNMIEFEKECPEGSFLKTAVKSWIPGGEFGHILSTRKDSLSFSDDCRLFTFDFETILANPRLSQSILPYIAYRIEIQVKRLGCPWLLIVDETKALLSGNSVFAEWYGKLHDEARRLRGVIFSSFQRIDQAAKLNALSLMKEACTNLLFLPNESADAHDYMTVLGVGDQSFSAIKRQSPLTEDLEYFAVLQRKNQGSVILTTDLSDLNDSEHGPLMQLFESGPEAANEFRRFELQYGAGPAAVGPYLEARKEKHRRESGAGNHLEEAAE